MSRRRTISPSKLRELEQENMRFSVSEPSNWSGSILDLPSPPSSKREKESFSPPGDCATLELDSRSKLTIFSYSCLLALSQFDTLYKELT